MTSLADLEIAAMARLRAVHPSLRDDHDDICQEALISYNDLDPLTVDEPKALMYALVDRRAIDRARSRSRQRSVETPVGLTRELANAQDDLRSVPPPDADRSIFATALDSKVRALPTAQRDAFILCELRGLTVREAASYTTLSPATVARRLADAYSTLQEAL